MTDKDIKDYCKSCSVEPPAMRFKCPECEHNPDKEQITIDGVDVSECVHYEDLSCTAFRDSCGYPLDCKDFFFCNYKQLVRKTQECKELKRQHQSDKGLIISAGKMNYQLLQEYDKLKSCLTEIKEIASKVLLNTHDLEQFKDADALFGALLEIHKKISECEVENDR